MATSHLFITANRRKQGSNRGKTWVKHDQASRKSQDRRFPIFGKIVLKKACHLPLLVHLSRFCHLSTSMVPRSPHIILFSS
jgi:hypothetical protein